MGAARGVLSAEQAEAVDAVAKNAAARMPERGFTPPPFVMDHGYAGPLAVHYLDALLEGDRRRGVAMILASLDEGISVEQVYLEVLAPAQAEVGRLWMTGKATVAQEHVATSITQSALGALSARVHPAEPVGRRVVVAGISPELHDIGIQMVSDFFELAGWDICYLGANSPLEALVTAVEAWRPDVVALSMTMATHLAALREAIAAIRATDAGSRARVLVGGRPFNLAPNLWHVAGADGWAPDAAGAVRVAANLVRAS
jgi:methanogenic corrinoid protein MtbC1